MRRAILFILFLTSALASHAAMAKDAIAKDERGDTYGAFEYSPALALGKANDFISQFSFSGGTLEFGWFASPNLAVGLSGRFHYFYQKREDETFVGSRNDATVHGTQFRTNYVIPAQIKATYLLEPKESIVPFVALGTGATHQNQTVEVGTFSFNNSGWSYSISPEIGAIFQGNGVPHFVASIRYEHALGTHELTTNQFISFNIGLLDWF